MISGRNLFPMALFRTEKDDIGPENAHFWDVTSE